MSLYDILTGVSTAIVLVAVRTECGRKAHYFELLWGYSLAFTGASWGHSLPTMKGCVLKTLTRTVKWWYSTGSKT